MAIVSLKPWGQRSCLALGLAQECAQKGNLCSHSRDTGRDGVEASPGSTACIKSAQGPDSSSYPHFQRPWGIPVLTPQPSSPAVTDSFQPCAHQHQGVWVWIFRVILLIQPYKTFPTTSLPPPLSSKKQWHERERGIDQTPPHLWPGAILQNAGRWGWGGVGWRPQKHQQIEGQTEPLTQHKVEQ